MSNVGEQAIRTRVLHDDRASKRASRLVLCSPGTFEGVEALELQAVKYGIVLKRHRHDQAHLGEALVSLDKGSRELQGETVPGLRERLEQLRQRERACDAIEAACKHLLGTQSKADILAMIDQAAVERDLYETKCASLAEETSEMACAIERTLDDLQRIGA